MKNFSLDVVIVMVIGLAGAALAQDKNPICQNAIPPSAPFDEDTANCTYRGKIHMGPSGGSPYQYDEKGSPQGLLAPGYVTCTFYFYVCGDPFFKGRVINVNAGDRCPDWQLTYREICCDKWEEAKRTKQPCDVMLDADCDGVTNSEDDQPTRAPDLNAAADITKSGGSIFINPSTAKAFGRQGPDESCSEVGQLTPGARLPYRRVVLNKDTGKPDWYLVEPPSGRPGWVPARDTSNTRPSPIPPLRPVNPPPSLPDRAISASPTAGGRARPNTSSGNRRGTRRSRPPRTLKRP